METFPAKLCQKYLQANSHSRSTFCFIHREVGAGVRPCETCWTALQGHPWNKSDPPPNGAICQIQLLSLKMTCCRFKNWLLCAEVVTRGRCDGGLLRPVLVTTVVIRHSAGGVELITKVAALSAVSPQREHRCCSCQSKIITSFVPIILRMFLIWAL